MRVILASSSPARATLLKNAGINFEVIVSDVDEDALWPSMQHLSPSEFTNQLAQLKAQAVAKSVEGEAIIIGADTMFFFKNQLFGKPLTEEVAKARLSQMQGSTGHLYTGHCVVHAPSAVAHSRVATATVEFATMSKSQIDDYVASQEPLNVAGSFTLDGLGAAFVQKVTGDAPAVIGLSLSTLRELVEQHGVSWTSLWKHATDQ